MPDEVDALIDEVRRKWTALDTTPLPGATDSAIAAFEQSHGVRMPADLRAWFGAFGGTEVWDDYLLRFWTLEEVERDKRSPEYFVFADYSISVWELGVSLSGSDTRVVRLCAPHFQRTIAPSFTAFLSVYLHDPESLFV